MTIPVLCASRLASLRFGPAKHRSSLNSGSSNGLTSRFNRGNNNSRTRGATTTFALGSGREDVQSRPATASSESDGAAAKGVGSRTAYFIKQNFSTSSLRGQLRNQLKLSHEDTPATLTARPLPTMLHERRIEISNPIYKSPPLPLLSHRSQSFAGAQISPQRRMSSLANPVDMDRSQSDQAANIAAVSPYIDLNKRSNTSFFGTNMLYPWSLGGTALSPQPKKKKASLTTQSNTTGSNRGSAEKKDIPGADEVKTVSILSPPAESPAWVKTPSQQDENRDDTLRRIIDNHVDDSVLGDTPHVSPNLALPAGPEEPRRSSDTDPTKDLALQQLQRGHARDRSIDLSDSMPPLKTESAPPMDTVPPANWEGVSRGSAAMAPSFSGGSHPHRHSGSVDGHLSIENVDEDDLKSVIDERGFARLSKKELKTMSREDRFARALAERAAASRDGQGRALGRPHSPTGSAPADMSGQPLPDLLPSLSTPTEASDASAFGKGDIAGNPRLQKLYSMGRAPRTNPFAIKRKPATLNEQDRQASDRSDPTSAGFTSSSGGNTSNSNPSSGSGGRGAAGRMDATGNVRGGRVGVGERGAINLAGEHAVASNHGHRSNQGHNTRLPPSESSPPVTRRRLPGRPKANSVNSTSSGGRSGDSVGTFGGPA